MRCAPDRHYIRDREELCGVLHRIQFTTPHNRGLRILSVLQRTAKLRVRAQLDSRTHARRPQGEAARARGRNGGRPKKLSPKELKTIRTLLRSNEVPGQDIAAQFKVNRSTLYRNVTAVP